MTDAFLEGAYSSLTIEQFWVNIIWMLEWAALLALSRVARWRCKCGDTRWKGYVLLPVFEILLVAKKSAILFMIIGGGLNSVLRADSCNLVGLVSACFLIAIGSNFFAWAYLALFYVLAAASAGSQTMKRATMLTVGVTILSAYVEWGESPYGCNGNSLFCHMTATVPLSWGQSFLTESLPAQDFFMWGLFGDFLEAWLLLAAAAFVIVTACLIYFNVWFPRQPKLAGCIFLLWSLYQVVHCFSAPFYREFKYLPTLIFATIESPLQFYIMILESRYWSSLSLSADIDHGVIDTFNEPLIMGFAYTMREIRSEAAWSQVLHIPESEVQVNRQQMRGDGATACVYSGRWDGKPVAVKALVCEHMTSGDLRHRCRELVIANFLQGSENVVRHHGFSLVPPCLYIIMENCESTLYSVLHGKSQYESNLSSETLMARHLLACGTAKGVAYLHSKQLIHRDIKSANVLVHKGVARLCDFGEAVPCDTVDQVIEEEEGCFVGTDVYAAPELFQRPRPYSKQSDVFSLALVLFECMAQTQIGHEYMRIYQHQPEHTTLLTRIRKWCEFLEGGHRPSLTCCISEWGEDVCCAVEQAWSQQPHDHVSADHLVCCLEEFENKESGISAISIADEGTVLRMHTQHAMTHGI